MPRSRTQLLTAPDLRAWALFLAFSTTVVTVWSVLLRGALAARHPALAPWGAVADLALTLPLAYWLLLVRPGHARSFTLFAVVLAGLAVARRVVPALPGWDPRALELLAAPLELAAIAWAVRRARRAAGDASADGSDRIRTALRAALPSRRLADLVASEIAVFDYGIAGWWRKREQRDGAFSLHERSGWGVILCGLLFLIVVESAALHLFLASRAPVVAWILTALDLYAILWFVADYRAMQLRPLLFLDDAIDFRLGFRWRAVVPFGDIVSIERASTHATHDLKLGLVDEARFVVTFRHAVTFDGIYGLRRNVRRLGVLVDDDAGFEARARAAGLWLEPAPAVREEGPAPAPPAAKPAPSLTREQWLAMKPDYIPEDDWVRFKP